MKNGRHKWNGQVSGSSDNCKGGLVLSCEKCGCVKEIVNGIPTYFIDDTLHDRKAPKCDERLVAGNEAKIISSKPPVIKSLPLLVTLHYDEAGWIAYLEGAGIVTQGKTEEEAIDELMISIKVKLLHDRKSGNVV